jgi:hypothetical protein
MMFAVGVFVVLVSVARAGESLLRSVFIDFDGDLPEDAFVARRVRLFALAQGAVGVAAGIAFVALARPVRYRWLRTLRARAQR